MSLKRPRHTETTKQFLDNYLVNRTACKRSKPMDVEHVYTQKQLDLITSQLYTENEVRNLLFEQEQQIRRETDRKTTKKKIPSYFN